MDLSLIRFLHPHKVCAGLDLLLHEIHILSFSDASVAAESFASSATSPATSPIFDLTSPAFTPRSPRADKYEDSGRAFTVTISHVLLGN
jgi:hypothetical protein